VPASLWVGKCEDRIPQLQEWVGSFQSVGVYVNPPRTGLEPRVLEFLAQGVRPTGPLQRIAYLSCNPVTLRRDLDFLLARGRYQVERVIPFDFFPHARTVETLVVIQCLSAGLN